jgi:predicted DNA-binding helix-hairpin-helix protein
MARDKVAYMLIYAALTGNTEVIRQAMELMDKIIKNAKEPTMRSLVMFDKQRIKNQQELTYESFSSLTRAFQEATNTALDARNDGRAAVVSAQYIIDAEQRGDEDAITEGREVYEAATFDNDTLSDVLRREREFETKAQNRQRLWRATTPDGEDYSYLLLPTTY